MAEIVCIADCCQGAEGVGGQVIGREIAERFGVEVTGGLRAAAARARFDFVPEGVFREDLVEVVDG